MRIVALLLALLASGCAAQTPLEALSKLKDQTDVAVSSTDYSRKAAVRVGQSF